MAKQKKYSQEFKEEATKLVTEQGYSYSQAARDLGVSVVSLRHWVLKLHGDPSNPKVPVIIPEAQKMAGMRKEIFRLKEEVEILKKATAFFAKESQ